MDIKTPGPDNDLVDELRDFETGNLGEDEIVDLFQRLVDSGLVWHLQGDYGRIAQKMIDAGQVTRRGPS